MKSFLSSFTIIGQCFLVDPPTADPPIADPPTADPTDDVLPVADPFTTDVPTSAASFTEPLTTACDPQPSSARAREKSNCFRSDRETYHMIREWFKSDESLIDDCNKTGMGRTTFYQKRYYVRVKSLVRIVFRPSGLMSINRRNMIIHAKFFLL